MPDQVTETLQSLAQAFSISKTAGLNPLSFTFELLRPGGRGKTIEIVENLIETVIENAPLDVNWIVKDVRFATSPIADQVAVGGQPIANVISALLTRTEQGFTDPPGVAGILAQLQGIIPLPIQKSVAKPLDVTFDVQWSVLDENGDPTADVSWTLGAMQGQGGAVPLQVGQALIPLALTFLPSFGELTLDPPQTSKRTVKVSIRLTALGTGGAIRATTGWVDLPLIDILLPVIPVPTIAFFFSSTLAGDALIAVPGNSPLEADTFKPALDNLNAAVSALDPLLLIGTSFLNSVGPLKDALDFGVTKIVFRKGDGCSDLHDIRFAGASITDWNGEDGDDHFASVALIGPPRRKLQCFNDTGFASGEGQIDLTLSSELMVKVLDLGSKNPGSDPAGATSVPQQPTGWNWGRARWINKFKNELSSYRFNWG